jgi:uncharacterized membrane protein YeaQ/YmgE (transglycosylase-associated protein family)
MDIMSLVLFLAIGALAGYLAGLFMKGGGYGLLLNIIIGVIGAFIGGFLFNFFGIAAGGLIGAIITAFVGAILLIFIVGQLKRV